MIKIQILGAGCPKCKKLVENVQLAARELGIQYELDKLSDPNEISRFGVLITPALVVDGELKVMGRVPSVEELRKFIISGQ